SLSFCANRVSAKSLTRSRGRLSEVMESVRIGVSAGLTLLYFGGFGRSFGKKPPATLIAAWTSCAGAAIHRARADCDVIVYTLNKLVEFIEASPAICPNWRSNGVVIAETITSALAPG